MIEGIEQLGLPKNTGKPTAQQEAEFWLESRKIYSKNLSSSNFKNAWGSLALAQMLCTPSESPKAIAILKSLLASESELIVETLTTLYQGYNRGWKYLKWDRNNHAYIELELQGIAPNRVEYETVIKKIFTSLENSNEKFDSKLNIIINILKIILNKNTGTDRDTDAAVLTSTLQATVYSTQQNEIRSNWLEKINQELLRNPSNFFQLLTLLTQRYSKSPELITQKILYALLYKIVDFDFLTKTIESILTNLSTLKSEHAFLAKAFIISFYMDRLNGQFEILNKNKAKIIKWCNELGKAKTPSNKDQKGLAAIYCNSILGSYDSYYKENPYITKNDKKFTLQAENKISRFFSEFSLFVQEKTDDFFQISDLRKLVKKFNQEFPHEIETLPTLQGWQEFLAQEPTVTNDPILTSPSLTSKIKNFWPNKNEQSNGSSKEEEENADNQPALLSTEERINAAIEIYLECTNTLSKQLTPTQNQKLKQLETWCLNYLSITLITSKEKINPILCKNLHALHQIGWPNYPNTAPYIEEAKKELLELIAPKEIVENSTYEKIIADHDLSKKIQKTDSKQCRQILYKAFQRGLERGELLTPNNGKSLLKAKFRRETLPIIYSLFINARKQNQKITLNEVDLSFVAQFEYLINEEHITNPAHPLKEACRLLQEQLDNLRIHGETEVTDELNQEFQSYLETLAVTEDQSDWKKIKYLNRRERSDSQVHSLDGRAYQFVKSKDEKRLVAIPYTTQGKKSYDMENWQLITLTAFGEFLANNHQNHCSSTSGSPVLIAGLTNISSSGFINGLSNVSGHYEPAADNMNLALTVLATQDLDLSSALIELVNIKKLKAQQEKSEKLKEKKQRKEKNKAKKELKTKKPLLQADYELTIKHPTSQNEYNQNYLQWQKTWDPEKYFVLLTFFPQGNRWQLFIKKIAVEEEYVESIEANSPFENYLNMTKAEDVASYNLELIRHFINESFKEFFTITQPHFTTDQNSKKEITLDQEIKKFKILIHDVCDSFTSQQVFTNFNNCHKSLYNELKKLTRIINGLLQSLPKNQYSAEKARINALLGDLGSLISYFEKCNFQIHSKKFKTLIKQCFAKNTLDISSNCHQLIMIKKILQYVKYNLQKIDFIETKPNFCPIEELDKYKKEFDDGITKLHHLYQNANDNTGKFILPTWLTFKTMDGAYSFQNMIDSFSDYLTISNYSYEQLIQRVRQDAAALKVKFDEIRINPGSFTQLQAASKEIIWSLYPAITYFKWFFQGETPYIHEIVREKNKIDLTKIKTIREEDTELVDTLSFLANGDGGLESDGAKAVAKLMAEWILELRKTNPNTFIVWGGDNIYSDGVDSPTSEKFDKVYYKQFEQWILDALSGSYFIAGNHDGKQFSQQYLLKSGSKTLPTTEVLARIWNQVTHTYLTKLHSGPIPPQEFYNQKKLLMSYVIKNKWFWNFPHLWYTLLSKHVRQEMILANTLAVDALNYLKNLDLITKDINPEEFNGKFKDLFSCTPLNNQIYRLIKNTQDYPNHRIIFELHNPEKTHSEKIDKPDTPYYIEEKQFIELKELLIKRITHLHSKRWNKFVRENTSALNPLLENLFFSNDFTKDLLDNSVISNSAKIKTAKLQFLLFYLNRKIKYPGYNEENQSILVNLEIKLREKINPLVNDSLNELEGWLTKTKSSIDHFVHANSTDNKKYLLALLKNLGQPFQELNQWEQDLSELTYPSIVKNTLKIKTPNAMQFGDLIQIILNVLEIPRDFVIAGHDHDMYLTENQAVIGVAAKKPQEHKWFKRLLIFLTNMGSGYFEITKDNLFYQYKSIPNDPHNKDSLCQGKTWTFEKNLATNGPLRWIEQKNISETQTERQEAITGFKQAIFKAYQDYIEIFRDQLKEKEEHEDLSEYIIRKELTLTNPYMLAKAEDLDPDEQFIKQEETRFLDNQKLSVIKSRPIEERLKDFLNPHGKAGIRRADDINGFLMCDNLADMSLKDIFNSVDIRLHDKYKENKKAANKDENDTLKNELYTFFDYAKNIKKEATKSVKDTFNPAEHPFFMFVYVNLRYTEPFATVLKDVELSRDKSLIMQDFKIIMTTLREHYGISVPTVLEEFYKTANSGKTELPGMEYNPTHFMSRQ